MNGARTPTHGRPTTREELRRLVVLMRDGRSIDGIAKDLHRSAGWASKWCNRLKLKPSRGLTAHDSVRHRAADGKEKAGAGPALVLGIVEL